MIKDRRIEQGNVLNRRLLAALDELRKDVESVREERRHGGVQGTGHDSSESSP